jgi:EF-P lysine aminoacylase GenX
MKPDFNQISAWKKIKDSQNLKENLKTKAQVLAAIREFFQNEDFLEMDTPTMVISPDPSPFNEVFESQTVSGERVFFTPSPEFFLKKLLVAGLKNIYQITKAYRDKQEEDPLHLREFTILEWYRSAGDYLDLMKDCESLTIFIQKKLAQKKLFYQGKEIKLTPPWPRISCREAFQKYAGINLDEFLDKKKAIKICQAKGYQVSEKNAWEELYHQVFLNEVEPALLKLPAVIFYDYPAPLAALSQIKKSDPRYAERFEFYLGGLEMGNGYSELTDFREQAKRLRADIQTRKAKKMKVFDYDHDFVNALEEGMPKTTGIAVGVDRLVMLFTDTTDIREVTPFAL